MTESTKVAQTDCGFAVSGEISFDNAVEVQVLGEQFIRQSSAKLEVDLAEVVASGTVTVAVLLGWYRVAERAGIGLAFVNITQECFEMARVCGVEFLLPIQNCVV